MKKIRIYTSIIIITLFTMIVFYQSSCTHDACKARNVICNNGGFCRDGDCICPNGYEGDSCQFKVNKKFDSYYACIRTTIIDDTINGDNDDTLRLVQLNDKFSIKLYSIRDTVEEVLNAKVNGYAITIPEQALKVGLTDITYTGNGSLAGTVLTVTLYKSWYDIGGNPHKSKNTYVGNKFEK